MPFEPGRRRFGRFIQGWDGRSDEGAFGMASASTALRAHLGKDSCFRRHRRVRAYDGGQASETIQFQAREENHSPRRARRQILHRSQGIRHSWQKSDADIDRVSPGATISPERVLRNFGPGSYFGELALTGQPRLATIVANDNLEVLSPSTRTS